MPQSSLTSASELCAYGVLRIDNAVVWVVGDREFDTSDFSVEGVADLDRHQG